MVTERIKAAKQLVELHREAEPNLREAFLLAAPDETADSPIKLLEVVDGAVEAGVMPVYFRADKARAIPFASILIELSPSEFEQYKTGTIPVDNETWTIAQPLTAQ